MLAYEPSGEAEARYIQRLPGQMSNAIRKVLHYHRAFKRYDMALDEEARRLLEELYGEMNPGWVAEQQYREAEKERANPDIEERDN